jgi:hypothetical protein
VSRCPRAVTVAWATSRGVQCASEYCERPSTGDIGFPDPTSTSPFQARPRGFPPTAVPSKLSPRGHPPVRLPVSCRVSRVTTRPRPCGSGHPSLGFHAPSRQNRWSPLRAASLSLGTAPRASQARFVPSPAFLTLSTASSSTDVAGLFHPAATSGLRSSGVSPRRKPHRLVACRCPRVVSAGRLPHGFNHWAPPTSIRLQGLALPPSPLRTAVV